MPSTRSADRALDFDEDGDVLTEARPKRTTRKPRGSRVQSAPDDEFGDGLELNGDGDSPAKKSAARTRRTRAGAAADEETPKPKKKPAARTRRKKAEEPAADETPRADPDGTTEAVETVVVTPRDEPAADAQGGSAERASGGSGERASGEDEGGDRGDRRPRRRTRRSRKKRTDGPPPKGNPGGRNGQSRGRYEKTRDGEQQGGGVIGPVDGVLELHPKKYGFLRASDNNYVSQETDAFVSSSMIDRFGLREGVRVVGEVGPGNRGQGPRLKTIETVDGIPLEQYADVPDFDKLTPINPNERLRLEHDQSNVSTRIMDMLTPLGKGQRALLVAPPRSGKTILLQDIAEAISTNHPEVHLIVLLIDERPEEVTEMQRSIRGEVVASSLDHDVESHVRVSQLVLERAKRMAEEGKDVVILLDSITRLARAFNKYTNSGRTTQGGIDIRALDVPKKLFGTARRFEEGGSVTVVGTALIETGSKGDDVIFQEFKGTGNMELILSRELSDRRIYPAIDVKQSGTRREEKLLDPDTLESVNRLRRSLLSLSAVQAMEDLSRTVRKFDTNDEFLRRIMEVM